MRELLGMPKSVLHASMRKGGGAMTAVFDYGDFVCQYEVCGFDMARFDAHVEVIGQHRIVKAKYDTPDVTHLPARLFHQSVVARAPVKTNIADARLDLELSAQIMGQF